MGSTEHQAGEFYRSSSTHHKTQWYSGNIVGLSAGRHGGPEFNPRPTRVGVRFLYKLGQPQKTFTSYSFVGRPIIGRDYFEEFHIHFI